ncbi:MAG: TonB-dependent receptor, partial [Rhizobacter sp.]|nr:TonB-dependent receptor [Chlorobiales bacterium]
SLTASLLGYEPATKIITASDARLEISFALRPRAVQAGEVIIKGRKSNLFGIGKLESIEGTAIYEAKKSEVITVNDLAANLAANNARQVFSKVAGLNVWESDCAGLQLSIGARGLSPSRSSNFNVRQNGYDISADALGYPENYYTPPVEALERIELVSGAASLQYGTQFGGMLNFVFKKGAPDKPLEIVSRQTLGSFGFFNSFNSAGGTAGAVNYYGFFQYKRGDCSRPNSAFDLQTLFASVEIAATEKLSLRAEYTLMRYLTQQAGGLTDTEFNRDPLISKRPRNWFKVNWQVAAVVADYTFSASTALNSRFFGLLSGRESLGNLESINRSDELAADRTLITGAYQNFGNETRLIHRYSFLGNTSALLTGLRYYNGFTLQQQGAADGTAEPNFQFSVPGSSLASNYRFPNRNFSLFAENIFRFTPEISLTAGLRYENIQTLSEGFYTQTLKDFSGNVISTTRTDESQNRFRDFVFFGLGMSYAPSPAFELYANLSQNYRSITFSDLRIDNPNFRIDPNLRDERGYNAELGARGRWNESLYYDVSLFYLRYSDRINNLIRQDTLLFNDYRYRTNVGDTRTLGLEAFAESDVWKLMFSTVSQTSVSIFTTLSLQDGRYISSAEKNIIDNEVELVPPVTVRAGATVRHGGFRATLQYSYIGAQFTDATNTVRATSNAVSGVVPAYSVADVSATYSWQWVRVEAGVNNLTNNFYFTRRAESYPGPGVIPAEVRSVYLTLGATF